MVLHADMVDAVLRTSRHRAPPQLCQVQVIGGHVACHVMYNASSTIRGYTIFLLEDRETSACTPASLTPGRCVIVSSPSAEMWATVVASCPSLHRNGRTGKIHQRSIIEPPGHCFGVRNKHTDTVLGPPGPHSSRLNFLVMRPQNQH